jgi:hypothetical protein
MRHPKDPQNGQVLDPSWTLISGVNPLGGTDYFGFHSGCAQSFGRETPSKLAIRHGHLSQLTLGAICGSNLSLSSFPLSVLNRVSNNSASLLVACFENKPTSPAIAVMP